MRSEPLRRVRAWRCALALAAAAAVSALPAQALDTLPGGIVRFDDYRAPDGFYAFWPVLPQGVDVYARDSLGLTVFSHGYGKINPINYGAWLRHLVTEQRQVVLYPRYQRNWAMPGSKAFAKTHNAGLRAGLAAVDTLVPALSHAPPIYIGHSYGGVLTAFVLANGDSLGYAPAFGAIVSAPGTNRLKGSRLTGYGDVDAATQLIIVTHEADPITGDEFARLLYETVPDSARALWLHQTAEVHGEESLGQGHSECYAIDEAFDHGRNRLMAAHARRIAREDALDHELYWALADEMIAARRERRLHAALRTTGGAYPFGQWSDGTPRRALRAYVKRAAAPLPFVERYGRELVLDFLSEPHDHLPPPRDVRVPYRLEEMLQRLSTPAEEMPAASPPVAPAEADGPAPRR